MSAIAPSEARSTGIMTGLCAVGRTRIFEELFPEVQKDDPDVTTKVTVLQATLSLDEGAALTALLGPESPHGVEFKIGVMIALACSKCMKAYERWLPEVGGHVAGPAQAAVNKTLKLRIHLGLEHFEEPEPFDGDVDE